VSLIKIDVVDVESFERLFKVEPQEPGREVLSAFAMPAVPDVLIEVVAELGRDDEVVATGVSDRLGEQSFGPTVAVGRGGVEEIHALVERVVLQRHALLVGELAPPVGAEDEVAEPEEADGEIGPGDGAVLHES